MASFQVEIAPSSPFGCVLRDHNMRELCSRESNSARAAQAAAFQKNLKELVRDQLHSRISVSSVAPSAEDSENRVNSNEQSQNLRRAKNRNSATENTVSFNNIENSTSSITHQQAKSLDRWAAKQARAMVSTIEKQSQVAELINTTPGTSCSLVENSQTHQIQDSSCETLFESQNLGASSLVQIWEARLQRPGPPLNRTSSTPNPVTFPSRTNSEYSDSDNVTSPVEKNPPSQSQVVDSAVNEESFTEWDTTGQSAPSSSVPSMSSDAGEGERVRIADIIRRLNSDGLEHEQGNNNNNNGSSELSSRRHSFCSDQGDPKTPRIRGRQALTDLLLQMELDRRKELEYITSRKAVSKFSQRGRIQAMLRLRSLERGVAIQDQHRHQKTGPPRTSSDVNRPHQRLNIMHLRERFSANIEQSTATPSAASKREPIESVNNSVHISDPSPSLTSTEVNDHQGTSRTEQQTDHQLTSNTNNQDVPPVENSSLRTTEVRQDVHEETTGSSDVACQVSINGEIETFDQEETVRANFDQRENLRVTSSLNVWDENEMEQEEMDDQFDFEGTNYDWFTDIARPRSYWEDQRQTWYEEMLTSSSERNEIRQLLERRTVSNVLSSDFRDRMDQMIMSRVQIQSNSEYELDEENHESMQQLMLSYPHNRLHTPESDQEEQEVDGNRAETEEETSEDEEEEDISNSHQYHEPSDHYYEPSSSFSGSPSPTRSWGNTDHNDYVDEFDQVSTSLSVPTSQSQTNNHGRQPSIEIQLINELRRHVEQLQNEVSELKKSMRSCMDMQVKMQNAYKQEGHQGEGNNSLDRTPQRRTCCICYEMQVDSFLYRCGHMCTCLKCAHELHWSSGKCPICRAPILDVVRAYVDS